MKLPVETKPALWGAAVGAIALAIVGFSWGGWVTGKKAETAAVERASAAVIGALAPVCVDRFRLAGDVTANLAAMKKVDSWAQGEFVEKGGWASVPGTNPPELVSAVAKACAQLLSST
jgi:alpha/beta superfamily hydrolase